MGGTEGELGFQTGAQPDHIRARFWERPQRVRWPSGLPRVA